MNRLGIIETHGSGAAFLLRDRPKSAATIPLGSAASADVSPESPYVVVRAPELGPGAEGEALAHRLAHEALDLHAAAGLGSLTTDRAEFIFVMWWETTGGTCLRFFDSLLLSWQIDARVHVGAEPAVPAPLRFPAYHPAFRFFRLSQLTDDLYDAFRNAYLALELLVSDVVPKTPNEGEPAWLKRAFTGPLASSVPGGVAPDAFVEAVYSRARLPLFHAKTQRQYILPQDSTTERDAIRRSLRVCLQTILNLFARHDPNALRGGGSMSRAARHAQCEAMFGANVLRVGSASTKTQYPVARVVSSTELRFDNPTCVLSASRPDGTDIDVVESLDLLRDTDEWATIEVQQPFSLAAITKIEVLLQVHQYNTREPKNVFAQ